MKGRCGRYLGLILGGLLILPAAIQPVGAKPVADVLAMRIETLPGDRQRFVIDISAPVEFRVFPLADPDRLVIDLPEANWRMPKGKPATGLNGADGRRSAIQGLRYGLFQSGLSRVVLDLAMPALVGAAHLQGPESAGGRQPAVWQVVIDVQPAGREQFQAAVVTGQADRQFAAAKSTATTPAATMPAPAAAAPAPVPQQQAARMPPPPTMPAPPAQAVAAARPPAKPAAQAGRTKPIIAIDAGHGGVDPGATSISGQFEKHITLIYAQEIKRIIELSGRFRVVLTRERDETLALRQRIAIARAAGATLFISLHADAIRQSSLRGGSVYTLSDQASDAEADALAQRENKADVIAGIDLSDEPPAVAGILIELAQRETRGHGARFARLLLDELARENAALLKKGHRSAGFAVLKAPDVPSVLFELGYLSNRQDEALLRQERHRRHIAQAILRAADQYFMNGVERSTTDSP